MIAPYKTNELGQFKEKIKKKVLENILVVMHDVSLILNSIKPGHVKTRIMSIATSKGADQPACLV